MKMNQDQIEKLYNFTQKHFVEWYDVQTELVDHLANGIEEQWTQHPELSFDEALNIEFKKFGIMGFSDVVEQKTKALDSYYRGLLWKYFRNFFRLPQLLLTILLIFSYYKLLQFSAGFHMYWLLIPSLTLVFGVPWYFLIKQSIAIKRTKKETGKQWLFNRTLVQLGGIVHFLNFAIYFQILFQTGSQWSEVFMFSFSVIIVLMGLIIYTAVYIVTPLLQKQMSDHYADYNFA